MCGTVHQQKCLQCTPTSPKGRRQPVRLRVMLRTLGHSLHVDVTLRSTKEFKVLILSQSSAGCAGKHVQSTEPNVETDRI